MPDDVLLAVKKNDGVVMVTFYPAFLETDSEVASLSSVADHMEYIGGVIG